MLFSEGGAGSFEGEDNWLLMEMPKVKKKKKGTKKRDAFLRVVKKDHRTRDLRAEKVMKVFDMMQARIKLREEKRERKQHAEKEERKKQEEANYVTYTQTYVLKIHVRCRELAPTTREAGKKREEEPLRKIQMEKVRKE